MTIRTWKFKPFSNGPDYLDGVVMDGAIRDGDNLVPICYCNEDEGLRIIKLIDENRILKAKIKRLMRYS